MRFVPSVAPPQSASGPLRCQLPQRLSAQRERERDIICTAIVIFTCKYCFCLSPFPPYFLQLAVCNQDWQPSRAFKPHILPPHTRIHARTHAHTHTHTRTHSPPSYLGRKNSEGICLHTWQTKTVQQLDVATEHGHISVIMVLPLLTLEPPNSCRHGNEH